MRIGSRGNRGLTLVFAALWCAAGITLGAGGAEAACNLIPQTAKTYDGALGATNRPFAAPGEPLEVRVRPCDSASPGLTPNIADFLVTVVYTPSGFPGGNRAVVLTSGNCASVDLTACTTLLGPGKVSCVPGSSSGMQMVNSSTLRFNFPDTDAALAPAGDLKTLTGPAKVAVTRVGKPLPCDLATTTCAARTSGHCSTTVATACTPTTQSLDCPSGETCKLDMVACADRFFANDGACGRSQPQGTFNHFTALPPANDFRADCFADPTICTGLATEVRATTDIDGNVLVPMNWQGVLVPSTDPVPRLLEAAFAPLLPLRIPGASFVSSLTPEGGPLAPIFVPQFDPQSAAGVLRLFGSVDAPYTILRLARRSATYRQCNGGFNDGLPCNGTDDCPGQCVGGMIPGARCTADGDCEGGTCGAPGTCEPTVCQGGIKSGQPCNGDGNCPGSECGPALFDFAPFAAGGVGPILLVRTAPAGVCQEDTLLECPATSCGGAGPCVGYAFEAQGPVTLQSINMRSSSAENAFALTTEEAVGLSDENGDSDTVDTVLTLRNRTTGALQSLGAPAGCGVLSTTAGRAALSMHLGGLTFPSVSTEGDIVAFLESESQENYCDETGDLDRFDPILRVFELGPTELTSGNIAVDGAPKINGQSVLVSNGIVYYRRSEAAQSNTATEIASINWDGSTQGNGNSGGGAISISAGGRFVAFTSAADNLTPVDNNMHLDGFLHDRCISWGVGPFCTPSTIRIAEDLCFGMELPFDTTSPSLSANGRYVAFVANSTVLIVDRCVADNEPVQFCTPATPNGLINGPYCEFASVASSGIYSPGAALSTGRAISDDGRYVVMMSSATDLTDPPDTNLGTDIFLRDRCISNGLPVGCTPHNIQITDAAGMASADHYNPSMSGDARFIVWQTDAPLVPEDLNGFTDIYLRDRLHGTTERISVASNGAEANNNCYNANVSADGRFVVFETQATNLAAGATNGFSHIFVRDRFTGTTETESFNSDGVEGNGHDVNATISADGRFVAWDSGASNYHPPGDGNGSFDVAVHDRYTGMTQIVSAGPTGTIGNGASTRSALSDDGSVVAFGSFASNLGPTDANGGVSDTYVRGLDPADTASDLSGDAYKNDIILTQLDTATSTVRPLCPAEDVAVIAGAAAFLRPESAGGTTMAKLPNCPAGTPEIGGVDLNGDADAGDKVVHYVDASGSVQNLDIAASTIAMSGRCAGGTRPNLACTTDADCPASTCTPTWIGALVPPVPNTTGILKVHPIAGPPNQWTTTNQFADSLAMNGDLVVFLTPERDANQKLNSDNDKVDRVIQVYDAAADEVTNLGASAVEFVIGSDVPSCAGSALVAFRTRESDECAAAAGSTCSALTSGCNLSRCDLNDDGDCCDSVLQVYAKGLGLQNTGAAVTPCELPACDPRQPYRIDGDEVKFLTNELDQGPVGTDLNGDSMIGIVLQSFDFCTGETTTLDAVNTETGSAVDPLITTDPPPGTNETGGQISVESGGRCQLTSPIMCTTSADCPTGSACIDSSCATTLTVPASCATNVDCPAVATCDVDTFVAAPAKVPAHDSVIKLGTSLKVKIPKDTAAVEKTVTVKGVNGEVLPEKELPGHLMRLSIEDGTCPPGTVQNVPDLDSKTVGLQQSRLVTGGKSIKGQVTLSVSSSAFTSHNRLAPARCTLLVSADTVETGNQDPSSRNNVYPLELSVVDLNDPEATTTHESVIRSAPRVKIKIAKDVTGPITKTVKVKLVNADADETAGHGITLVAGDGDCPAGTVSVVAPATQTVAGGAQAAAEVNVTVSAAAFQSLSPSSPARCTAVLTAVTAVMGNSEPVTSNNSTQLIVQVNDKNDY